jgi:hypothetical protein
MLINLISNLITIIVKVFVTLIQFLIVVILGLIAAVLFALPWLMRAAALASWLTAIYMGISAIQTIYVPFSAEIPLRALQFAVILIAVAWMMSLMISNIKHFWGGLFLGGLVMGGCAMGANWLADHWRYADLMFRALPAALFALLLIYETIHIRAMRQSRQPAANLKGGDVLPVLSVLSTT